MIERLYLEEYLSFSKIELFFEKGLIIFSGPSGAGKSILFSSIVSLFGLGEGKAKQSEITLSNIKSSLDGYLLDDEFTIKQITTNKTRYYLANQAISKGELGKFSHGFFKHLHLKDTSDFESDTILDFFDHIGAQKYPAYQEILKEWQTLYKEIKIYESELKELKEKEQKSDSYKEFIEFEIEKIKSIDPKEGEYEELKSLKDTLNKKEKIEKLLNEAKTFLESSHKISQALDILECESSFFDDAINEIYAHFDRFYQKMEALEDTNIEATLDRIENLASLIKKYGSIEDALHYKAKKEAELEIYENLDFEKAILEKKLIKALEQIKQLAPQLTNYRKEIALLLQEESEKFLQNLYLKGLTITLEPKELGHNGADTIQFTLAGIPLSKLSSGEFNRLRLALLAARTLYDCEATGILFLDEIDANLSGKESESIATVLKTLSKNYQIFAISHQPQLSSTANQHFLVEKNGSISSVRLLQNEERVAEISRMISGENITQEATLFAKKLLSQNNTI